MTFLLDPIDDPRPLLDPVETALADYEANIADYVAEAMAAVVEWRWATSSMAFNHPLFGVDTVDSSDRRPYKPSWVAAPDLSAAPPKIFVKHGYDDDDLLRVDLVESSRSSSFRPGRVYVHRTTPDDDRSDHCDVIKFIFPDSVDQPAEVFRIDPRLRRVTTDAAGRVVRQIKYSSILGADNWFIDRFEFESGTSLCIESLQQLFLVINESCEYHRGLSDQDLREGFRPIESDQRIGNLVESMDRCRRTRFDYDAEGRLKRETDFRRDGREEPRLEFE